MLGLGLRIAMGLGLNCVGVRCRLKNYVAVMLRPRLA